MQRENTVLIDWLSITSKTMFPQDFMSLLGMAEGWQQLRGVRGYAFRYYRDSISIHFGGREGIWLEMSGQGCRAFETYGRGDYDVLFDAVMAAPEDMNITRLDVAYDDYDGILDIDRVCDDTRNGKYRSKADYWEVLESSKGKSCLVGSPQSLVLVRIYDKLAERLSKIHDSLERDKIISAIPHWVRCEMQLRDERAREFVKYIRCCDPVTEVAEQLTLGQAFSGVLRSYLEYGYGVPARDNPKKIVWHTFSYWQKLLNTTEALSVYRKPGIDYNLARCENYIANIAGNAVDCLLKIKGVDGFLKMIDNRQIHSNPKYYELIRSNGTFDERYKKEFEALVANHMEHTDRFALFLNSNRPVVIRNTHYLMCTECGSVKPFMSFASQGTGGLVNFGVCHECSKKSPST